MAEIVFATPPPRRRVGRPPGRMAEFVDTLKQHPGEWAVYPVKTNGAATDLRRRYGCEVVQRTIDGQVTLYARWNQP